MTPYSPKKLRPWRLTAITLRAIGRFLGLWPLFVIAALAISPVGPHIRWQYTYEPRGSVRYFTDCLYLGSRGFVHHVQPFGRCPLFILIDRRRVD